MDLDIIMPDDYVEETSTPTEEEIVTEEVEDTTPTEPVTETAEQPKVKLKYNHEEKEYSLDDVVPLAQKGLNYDKLQEKLQALENDERFAKFDKVRQLSELYGMSDDDLVNSLYNQYFESQAENQGLTPQQVQKEWELTQREARLKAESDAKQKQSEQQASIDKFALLFPNVKGEDINPETWQKVNDGMDLITAYLFQQNQEKETEITILKQNANNQKKAPVVGVSTHGSDDNTANDDFLIGLLGG